MTTVSGLKLRDTVTGEESTLDVTGFFLAIGHIRAANSCVSQWTPTRTATCDEGPYFHTNLDGVFAAGDLVDRTSAGDHGGGLGVARPRSTRNAGSPSTHCRRGE